MLGDSQGVSRGAGGGVEDIDRTVTESLGATDSGLDCVISKADLGADNLNRRVVDT